jgi:DNA-binding NtrC family response regulator
MTSDARPRVLCVDDDANVLSALHRQLRGRYDVVLAVGATAALARLADSGPFAVVMSDLNMPGVDGLTFLAQVRTVAPRTVALLMSGGGDRVSPDAAARAGVFALVEKPSRPDVIWASLDLAIAHHERGGIA